MKELSEMTLEELWMLFPIILKEHNIEYKNWYEIEKKSLLNAFNKDILRINHIGSTAVKDLIAKPTVDILMEVSEDMEIIDLKNKLSSMGWQLMNTNDKYKLWLVFNKGYTKYGFEEKVYHLHVRYKGDWNELYFRDYLIEHEAIANEYGKLKINLSKKYEHDREAYTEAKTDFVLRITKIARDEYKNKY